MQKFHKETLEDTLFLFFLSSFFLLFRLGWGSLASWDEALYAGVAKDMVVLGHWFRLTLGGEPWFDKPPLAMWLTAFFYKCFGINEFSARFFSALCGVGTVMVTYFAGRKLLGRWQGFLGALVLISSLHFIRFARFGMTDSPFVFFFSLALYFFWLGRERNRYLIFSGVALGGAIMTKSFAAFLFFPVVFTFALASGELRIFARSSFWVGIIIAVLIALPWNLAELFANHNSFTQGVLFKHLFLRTLTPLDGHAGNWYFYIRTMVNKYHPWILVGILSAPWFLFKSIKERKPEIVFLTSWMFVIFVIVTLIRTKLPWYILPVYPALSLSVGYMLAKVFKDNRKNFIRLAFFLIMCLHVHYGHIFHFDYSRQIKGIAPLVKQAVPLDQRIHLYENHNSPAAIFYLERPISYLDDTDSLNEVVGTEKVFFCIINDESFKRIEGELSRLGLTSKGRFEDFQLIGKK